MIYLRLEICSDEIKLCYAYITAQEMKFCIKDSFSKCEQIRRKLRIWSHFLKKSLKENFIFCTMHIFVKYLNITKKSPHEIIKVTQLKSVTPAKRKT